MAEEKTLYEAHPSTWRNRPVLFLVLLLSVVGVLVILIWLLKAASETLTVSEETIVYRRGLLSKHTSEIKRSDVRNVQVSQTLGQRIFGVGSIAVSSAGTSGKEIAIAGIPSPHKAQQAIKAKTV